MLFKYELQYVAFTWPNVCLWVVILCICNLKRKKPLKTKNLKSIFWYKKHRRFLPVLA